MAVADLRPRAGTEIVDAAFQLYRRHFRPLITLMVVLYTPSLILEYLSGRELVLVDPAWAPVLTGLLWLVATVTSCFAEAATVVAMSNCYLRGEADPAATLRRALHRLFIVLIAVSIKYFLILLGVALAALLGLIPVAFMGLIGWVGGVHPLEPTIFIRVTSVVIVLLIAIIAGLNVFARFFAVTAAVVLEGAGIGEALQRSNRLARGNKRRIIGTLALPLALYMTIVSIVPEIVRYLPAPYTVSFLVSEVPAILMWPVMSAIATLLYYDLRIRKEGFDIEVSAAELEASGGPRASFTPVTASP